MAKTLYAYDHIFSLYGLTLREEDRFTVFENRALDLRRKQEEADENCFIICTFYQILLGWTNQGR